MTGDAHISLAGRTYGLGRREDCYGIFRLSDTSGEPLERFSLDATGWFAANARLRELEAARAAPRRPRRAALTPRAVALGLFVVGIGLGIGGLFPDYLEASSIAATSDWLVSHACYLAAWSLAAVLVAGPAATRRAGACFGLGTSVITLGFFLSDSGIAIARGASTVGAGYALSLASFALCAAASATSAAAVGSPRPLGAPRRDRLAVAGATGLAALGAAITFAPSWDRFVLTAAANGHVEVITAGNAFSNPAAVIAGDVVTMVLIVVLPVLAGAWRPVSHGAALLLGGLVPLAAQAGAAVVQVGGRLDPSLFGISAGQAAGVHLRIASGLTAPFYLYCGFVALLVIVGLGALAEHRTEPVGATPSPVGAG